MHQDSHHANPISHQVVKYLTSLIGLLLSLLLSSTAIADCRQEPTPTCLLQTAIQLWQQLDPNDSHRAALAAQLGYEASHYHVSFASDEGQKTEASTLQQLRTEDKFIQSLRNNRFPQGKALLATLNSPLQDSFAAAPQALFIEYLTLALQDQQADSFKKKYYETLVKLDDTSRTLRMIEVSRHEILGGQPDKGLHTLANTGVDEFSDSAMLNDKIATEILASQSQLLFLHPEDQIQDCNTSSQIAYAAADYLKPTFLSLQRKINNIPDERIRLRTRLEVAHLFHNSEQCTLLTRWLVAQTIQEAVSTNPIASDATVRRLIYLTRSIRRYIF